MGDENRIPLRAQSAQSGRISKRESMAGLRSLFNKSKFGRDARDVDGALPLREPSKPGSIRASLAEISHWPHMLQPQRSETSLLGTARSPSTPKPLELRSHSSTSRLKPPGSGKSKVSLPSPTLMPRSARMPTGESLPLFHVLPQAIKQAALPACTLSADVLLRLNGSRGSLTARDDLTLSTMSLDDDESAERKAERIWKKHQRALGSKSILEWTTKIYVLVTSGVLLQYSSEGPYDRLPEKILHLTRDSAAFASDAIPGRHWVLQVSSTTDADGVASTDSKSLFAKFTHRASDKKQVSNFLLVLESAEDMDSWLAILRQTIEALGGKKKLSETGTPEVDEFPAELKPQASQRTLIVRDLENYAEVVKQDFAWSPETTSSPRISRESVPADSPFEPHDGVLDDISTTGSRYSSDGQVLDSLRENNNRLSFVSTGQRTFVTSEGSSPACSPVRASFSSHGDEHQQSTQENRTSAEVRLRPNAQAISHRRQSMQPLLTAFESRIDPAARPHSTIMDTAGAKDGQHHSPVCQSTPNFSVPHPSTQAEQIDLHQGLDQGVSPRSSRKPPPTALALARPLSIVMDQPSPSHAQECSRNLNIMCGASSYDDGGPKTAPLRLTRDRDRDALRASLLGERLSSFAPAAHEQTPGPSSAEKSNDACTAPAVENPRLVIEAASPVQDLPSPPPARHWASMIPRAMSSMSNLNATRKLSTSLESTGASSPTSQVPEEERSYRHSLGGVTDLDLGEAGKAPALPTKSKERKLKSPLPDSAATPVASDANTRGLVSRKSMPHLTNVPPPVPPPTCALPPIPKKYQDTSPTSPSSALHT